MRNYLELCKNENITYQNLHDTANMMRRWKFIAITRKNSNQQPNSTT